MSDVGVPGDGSSDVGDLPHEGDLSPEGARPPEQQQKVQLYLIPGVFDQDKSPDARDDMPIQIATGEDGYTSVSRGKVSTLYDPDGRVNASIPSVYLSAYKRHGKRRPVLIGKAGPDQYLLLPSSARGCPKEPGHSAHYISAIKKDVDGFSVLTSQFLMPGITFSDGFRFLESNGLIEFKDTRPSGTRPEIAVFLENFAQKWEELIQTGKIKFVDDEKVAKFNFGAIDSPSLDLASEDVKRQVKAASWKADFPQKKSLFLMERKLYLLDWSDAIANNWSITALELPTAIPGVTAAGLDPKDNFLLVGLGHKFYVLDLHKKPMEIVFELENPNAEFDGPIRFREGGSILVADKKGNLTNILSNLDTFASRSERLEQERLLERLRVKQRLIRAEEKVKSAGAATVAPEMKEISNEIAGQFANDIAAAASLDDIESIRAELRTLKSEYEAGIRNSKLVDGIFKVA